MTLSTEAGRANRRKGLDTERAVARYLRSHGFDGAERAVRTGYTTPDHTSPDPGDITGIPGTVWSVKNDASQRIPHWLDEIEHTREAYNAELAVLVVRRTGKADPGRWWSWITLTTMSTLMGGTTVPHGRACLELNELITLLRLDGYGNERSPA